jgi:hypothetical protein
MTSGEMLPISPVEDRAGALRARAHLRHSEGGRFDQRQRRRGQAAPWAKPTSPINVSTAARLRRAARNEMPKQTRHRTCAFGTRAAGAPAETPRKMRSILGGSA